jgi:hypothetical protein
LTIGSGREARYVEQITKILVALAILAALPVMALDEEDVRIDKEGRAYLIHMVFDVPAHVNQIKTVLTASRAALFAYARSFVTVSCSSVRK